MLTFTRPDGTPFPNDNERDIIKALTFGANWTIALTRIWWQTGDAHISTAYHPGAFDFGHGEGPPLIFETASFYGQDFEMVIGRWSDMRTAWKMHQRIVVAYETRMVARGFEVNSEPIAEPAIRVWLPDASPSGPVSS